MTPRSTYRGKETNRWIKKTRLYRPRLYLWTSQAIGSPKALFCWETFVVAVLSSFQGSSCFLGICASFVLPLYMWPLTLEMGTVFVLILDWLGWISPRPLPITSQHTEKKRESDSCAKSYLDVSIVRANFFLGTRSPVCQLFTLVPASISSSVNDESNGEQYLFKTKVIVSSDGTVTWYSPSILKSSCKIDVKDFPFDTQTCKITFGSWTFHGFKLDLHFFGGQASAELSKFTPSGEWELLSVDATRNVIYYSCCPEPYPDLTFNVKVKRRTLFYVNNLIVPCVVLALLTATVFVFPPESGERVSLVMTILLGMTVFMIIFTESIPSTSEVVPLIGKYFTAVLVEIALCLIATCITLKLHYHDPRSAVPAWARVLLFDVIGRVLCPFGSRHFRTTKILKVEEMPTSPTPDSKAHRRVHPLVELKEQNGTVAKDHGTAGARTDACGARSVSAVGMDKICSYIDCLTTEDVRRSEWHMAAKVIDRLFLAIFILTFVITTFAMLFNRWGFSCRAYVMDSAQNPVVRSFTIRLIPDFLLVNRTPRKYAFLTCGPLS